MQKIVTYLTFNNRAEEAMNHYTSVFKNSKVKSVSRYPAGLPLPEGTLLVASIELEGQEFNLLNGGPKFNFSMGVSLLVNCKTQEEVDHYWEKLSEGGEKSRCGWLADKFGMWWQIIPTILGELMSDPDTKKANRVMQAMLQMDKIDIAKLKEAADGK
jgi:predicted 3-demethylubiquinone-9 3-methyltransferase (glyoxalase superfamily)